MSCWGMRSAQRPRSSLGAGAELGSGRIPAPTHASPGYTAPVHPQLVHCLCVATVLALQGCCPPPGGSFVAGTRYGGGTVTVRLSSVDGEGGVVGSGTALGWDPASVDTGDEWAGGYLYQDEQGLGDSGHACIPLDRTDTFACAANTLCIAWGEPEGPVNTSLVDVEDGVDVTTSSSSNHGATTYNQNTAASGNLSLDRAVWNLHEAIGEVDCGVSALELEWAFDEGNPFEVIERYGPCL